MCTADGRKLAGGLQVTIAGPPMLSVADAEVEENIGRDARFRGDPEPGAHGDGNGRVRDGRRHRECGSGLHEYDRYAHLRRRRGTSKTVAVPVLDDAHDEGSETMTLRLRNPSPTRVKLADAEATGTINNSDPMPRAWITRFGRTVGGQVVDALTGRLEGGGGTNVTVGGVSLTGRREAGAGRG